MIDSDIYKDEFDMEFLHDQKMSVDEAKILVMAGLDYRKTKLVKEFEQDETENKSVS
jgi:hypothetical protein